MSQQDPVVRASELAQYAYCARAWWFARVKGYPSANVIALEEGTAGHRAHGRSVAGSSRLRRLALVLLMIAGILFATWLAMSVGG